MNTQDNLWDEQGMADLVGLQLSEPGKNPDQQPVSPYETLPEADLTSSTSEPLLDPEDLADSAPLGTQKKRGLSLATNPFTKLGVVAAGTGLVIGILAVFTNSIMNREEPKPTEETQAEFADPMVEAGENQSTEDDRGQILTDLAMGQQQAELEALTEQAEQTNPEPASNAETPQFSPATPVVTRTPQPVQRAAPAPVPRFSATPAPRTAPNSTPKPRPVTPAPNTNPTEQWMALAHIGSYGRSTNTSTNTISENTAIAPTAPTPDFAPVQVARSIPVPSPPAINHAEEAAILLGQPIAPPVNPSIQAATLVTGTQASAVLTTPLIWATATESDQSQFVVQLTEPILTPEGKIGLPADTQFVAQVQSIDDSGLTRLTVTTLIQNGQEVVLPDGTIQLRGKEGIPLIAQKYGDPGPEIANRDLNNAVISGLARAAGLFNRPKSSTVITNAGGSTITQDNGDTNLLAGILEGAFSELTEQMAQRNQASLEEILDRPPVWYLPPGTEIEVFINRTVTL